MQPVDPERQDRRLVGLVVATAEDEGRSQVARSNRQLDTPIGSSDDVAGGGKNVCDSGRVWLHQLLKSRAEVLGDLWHVDAEALEALVTCRRPVQQRG
ncbi:hypothetical protein [Pengzhenrongella sicca]|uniref:Uncharacterized protein n=1 Tax=Pengzhenrongella sicca TaxID=2819238 RepID=A0A8A4ZC63_9MICO|nr:hypothetical protein [Pengzhenrongella sicca]QTE28985.1 hypothetical protein J4E96_16995 [Pengzhenrongella sicca]